MTKHSNTIYKIQKNQIENYTNKLQACYEEGNKTSASLKQLIAFKGGDANDASYINILSKLEKFETSIVVETRKIEQIAIENYLSQKKDNATSWCKVYNYSSEYVCPVANYWEDSAATTKYVISGIAGAAVSYIGYYLYTLIAATTGRAGPPPPHGGGDGDSPPPPGGGNGDNPPPPGGGNGDNAPQPPGADNSPTPPPPSGDNGEGDTDNAPPPPPGTDDEEDEASGLGGDKSGDVVTRTEPADDEDGGESGLGGGGASGSGGGGTSGSGDASDDGWRVVYESMTIPIISIRAVSIELIVQIIAGMASHSSIKADTFLYLASLGNIADEMQYITGLAQEEQDYIGVNYTQHVELY
jgi:hypothetical protein